jgi:hypothetical protein
MTYERYGRGYLVRFNGELLGCVWCGCGTVWAGSRYANGIEVTGNSRKQTAAKLARMPRVERLAK